MSTPTTLAHAKMAFALQNEHEESSWLKNIFKAERIILSRQGDILRLCYADGSPNWSELSRSSRNTFWFQTKDTQQWEILRMGLERGAEIARPEVQTTQDVSQGDISQFDANQKAVMAAFLEKKELPNEAVLTSKSDGCCLFVTFIPTRDEQAILALQKRLGEIQDDNAVTFCRIVTSEARSLTGGWFPVFGTNGGLFTGGDMVRTWTQALAGTAGIELSSDRSWEDTLKEALPNVLPKMLALVQACVTENGGVPCRVNLAFEGVLANRRDVWGTTFHRELVVDYSWSGLSYLGATWGFGETVGTYRPHFEDDTLVSSLGFRQPLYWRIGKSTAKAEAMLGDLDRLLKGEIQKSDFFESHPPSNDRLPDDQTKWVVDYEGFVLLDFLPEGRWHYSKLKTALYYKLHKLKLKNFPELLELPLEVADKMPNLRAVRLINVAMDQGITSLRGKIETLLGCYYPNDFSGSIRDSSPFKDELMKAKNEKHLASVERKIKGAIAAYTAAFEAKEAKQLPMLMQNASPAVIAFREMFISTLGFEPKDEAQLKQIINLLNPRMPFDLEEELPAKGKTKPQKVKHLLFNAFSDAVTNQ